jgi:hypothetical protein
MVPIAPGARRWVNAVTFRKLVVDTVYQLC